jgi:elongation factor 1-gamma
MAPTIYTYPHSFRTAKALIVAQYENVSVDVPAFQMGTENKTPEFLAKFLTGTVPAMEDGELHLFESNAIAYYLASMNADSRLLGKTPAEKAEVIQWMFFSDNAITSGLANWVFPVAGFMPYNKAAYNKAVEDIKKALDILNRHLLTRTFLVTEHITLADIVMGCQLHLLYKMVLAPEYRDNFKNVTRYFSTLMHQKEFVAVWGETVLCEKEAKYQPPKKEEKKKAEKKVEKKKPAEEEEEDEAPKEVKPKSKLDLLPPTKLNLEEWKRVYSNNDTKPTAMDWFWEHYDPEGYSLWKVDYKYNDELAKIFMSANLVGGFFNRLERARKYAFGSLCVLGEDNANCISGYFVIRGQEIPFEVSDAADFDSYTFVKVDHSDEKVKSEVADYFAWEGDFGGKPFADAKVFK